MSKALIKAIKEEFKEKFGDREDVIKLPAPSPAVKLARVDFYDELESWLEQSLLRVSKTSRESLIEKIESRNRRYFVNGKEITPPREYRQAIQDVLAELRK